MIIVLILSHPNSGEELAIELETLGQLQDSVFNSTRQRSVRLRGAVGVADRFQNNFEATFDLLSDLRDDIMGQDMPAAETEVVLMQQKELKVGALKIFNQIHFLFFDRLLPPAYKYVLTYSRYCIVTSKKH